MQNNIQQQSAGVYAGGVGHIVSVYSGVAKVVGLTGVFVNEVLVDGAGNDVALVVGFDRDLADVLFFRSDFDSGARLYRSGNLFSIPVGEKYVGRVVDGLGVPLDGLGAIHGDTDTKQSVFRRSVQIIEREPVTDPFTTGIKVIDVTLPLGRGQRELIIGDRRLGKSALALDIVLNQKKADPPMFCVYVLCGQRKSQLEETIALLEKHNSFLYTVVVAATAEDSFAERYLAPFVGCTIGEHLRDQGKDAVVIYDDLSKHAKVYRDISLLLERTPGRESYPGDIFSLHASLLERSAKLSKRCGGGSLSALPIVETEEGDISAFIPTNLISITDGQIYLERGLFRKGFLPAVNVGLSISRVGSAAQPSLLRDVVGGVRLALSQYKELQKLIQLETRVSEQTKKDIHRGGLIVELLKQDRYKNIPWEEQVILFYTVENGLFDDIEKEQWLEFEDLFLELVRNRHWEILESLRKGKYDKKTTTVIQDIVNEFKAEFIA